MKLFICIIPILFSLKMIAQPVRNNFTAINRKVAFINTEKIDSLSKQLDALGKTDLEKVRAIFRWISTHISYNVRIFGRNKIDPGNFFEDIEDTAEVLPSLNERVAAKVLKRKIAFCDGYSRLFKVLCDRSGIRSEIIQGYARTNENSRGRFGVNHSWNAVYIDSTWFLLDVTWASGFVTYGNEYIRQYNDAYFLSDPYEFFRDHYPEDIQWTLIKYPPVYNEFNQQPFRHSGFKKLNINSFLPQKGIISASVGDTLQFEIKTNKEIKHFFVASVFRPDTIDFLQTAPFFRDSDRLRVKYVVTGNEENWLYVFCNEEPVLQFKLNIKTEESKKDSRINFGLKILN